MTSNDILKPKTLYWLFAIFTLPLVTLSGLLFSDFNLPPLHPMSRALINCVYLNLGIAYAWILIRPLNLRAFLKVSFIMAGFFLALSACLPVFSGDLMEYLFRGRILAVHHDNPYLHLPKEYPNDPFFPFSIWRNEPVAYGPFQILAQTLPLLVFSDSVRGAVWLYKVLLMGFVALMTWALLRIQDSDSRSSDIERVLLLWNPLLLISTFVDGHNDIIMVALMFCSYSFFVKSQWTRSFLCWTLAFLVKYIVIVVLPLLVLIAIKTEWKKCGAFPWKFIAIQILVQSAVIVAAFFPLWIGPDTFFVLFRFRSIFYSNTMPYAFQQALDFAGIHLTPDSVKTIFNASYLLTQAGLLLYVLKKQDFSPQTIARLLAIAIVGLYFIISFSIGFWYLLWALPWLALARWPWTRTIVFLYTFLGLFSYFKRINFLMCGLLLACLLLYGVSSFIWLRRGRGERISNHAR